MHELHRHVPGVRAVTGRAPEGDQAAPASKALRHQVAEASQPLALLAEEPPVCLGAPHQQRLQLGGGVAGERRLGQASACSRSLTVSNQSRHAWTPSPVRALTSIRCALGLT